LTASDISDILFSDTRGPTMTADALFAACLAARKTDRLCWAVLADFVRENLGAAPVVATAGGRTLRVKRFGGTKLLEVTVNHSGGVVGADKALAKWLRTFALNPRLATA
jgi:hypothetical protein